MRARLKTECFICYRVIRPGMEIAKSRSGKFVHDACGKAAAELARSRARIESGESFAARRPFTWRLGQSVSDAGRSLNR